MPETPETLSETFARPETLMRVPVGLASPLWALFAGAAVGGSAWWWMTRWTRPENLEAMFGAAAELPGAATVTAAITRPVIEAAEAAVEIAVEAEASAMEAVEAEMAAAEAVMDAPVLDAPVGGEAAPIGPAVAELARKPRAKKGEPKAE